MVGPRLLWLGLPVALLGLVLPCGAQTAWGHTVYDIVVPRQISPRAGRAPRDRVSYSITIQGTEYTVRLRRKKDLAVKKVPVFTRDARGALLAHQPHAAADCYYQGYVEGSPGSGVTLSTCHGLRGLLHLGNQSYSIEPLPGSATFEHVLLPTEAAAPGAVMCRAPPATGPRAGAGAASRLFQPWGETRYLELLVVVDKDAFDAFARNITNVTLEVIEIINLVDGLFYPLRLRVLITALEVWTERNPIRMPRNVTEILVNFNRWRKQKSLSHTAYDVGCLFTALDFGRGSRMPHTGSKANVASACDRPRAAAVVAFARLSYIHTVIHVAHELGHVVGMGHDGQYCMCGNSSKCIMNMHIVENYQFSNCSARDYFNFMGSGKGSCLNNIPQAGMPFLPQRCGNGILEPGEQCDCGSAAQCKLDACCSSTCRRKRGAVCATGGCCKNCKPLPEGAVCRDRDGPCDLPEYCSGKSEHCPADVTMQDGTVCAEDGYCYSGKCQSRSLLCATIFGKDTRPAPLQCFKEVNTKGDRFGNCWGSSSEGKFEKCEPENVLCGRMQCTNVRRVPWLPDHSTIIQTPVGDTWCWGTDYHLGLDILDVGAAADGLPCGERRLCVNRTCVTAAEHFKSSCSAEKTCRGNGVCNTKGNCHCHDGWAPPFCMFAGFGGSVDSGPPPVTKKGLFRLTVTTIAVTAAVLLVLAALGVLLVKGLRRTQALGALTKCLQGRGRPPAEDGQEPREGDGARAEEGAGAGAEPAPGGEAGAGPAPAAESRV